MRRIKQLLTMRFRAGRARGRLHANWAWRPARCAMSGATSRFRTCGYGRGSRRAATSPPIRCISAKGAYSKLKSLCGNFNACKGPIRGADYPKTYTS